MAGNTVLTGRSQPGGLVSVVDLVGCPGNVFYVGSVAGAFNVAGVDAAGYGLSPDKPCATIDYAIGLCTASQGDVIFVLPYHSERIANAQIALDVAGVQIIGIGSGLARPRVIFDHANASIDVAASGCAIKNLVLLPSVTDTLIGIDINTLFVDTIIEDVEVLPGEDGGGVDEFAAFIDCKVGVSRTVIRRCKVRQHASAAGVIAAVRLAGASDDITIEDCDFVCKGAAVQGCIYGLTTLSTNVRCRRNTLVSDTKPGIKLLTGTTGSLEHNRIFTDLATINAAVVADGCASFWNAYVEVGGESNAQIGTASVDD